MSGYWLMGSEKKDKAPSKTINNEITRERTGLRMKMSNMFVCAIG